MNKNPFKKEAFLQNLNNAIVENKKKNNLIIFVQHNSETLLNGSNNWKLYSELIINENDIIIQKKHGNAFENTNCTAYAELAVFQASIRGA